MTAGFPEISGGKKVIVVLMKTKDPNPESREEGYLSSQCSSVPLVEQRSVSLGEHLKNGRGGEV